MTLIIIMGLVIIGLLTSLSVVLTKALLWILNLGRLKSKAQEKLQEFEDALDKGDYSEIETLQMAAHIAVNEVRSRNKHEVEFVAFPFSYTLRSLDNMSDLWDRFTSLRQRANAQKVAQ